MANDGTAPTTDETTVSFPRQHAATRRFTLGAPRNLSVAPDGSRVVFLRSKAGDDPVLCLWELDVTAGRERLVVDPGNLPDADHDLPPAERARRERARESAGGIVSYSLDKAAELAAFALGGSLFVVRLADGHLRSIDARPGVFDPRIDPTGQRVAYVAGQDLHLTDLGTHTDTVLAADDDPVVSWGRAEFVAAEEMGRSRGFWWAPDGASLLATRVSEAPVATWWIADPANPDHPPTEIRYPAAGTANAGVELALITLDGTQTPVAWDAPTAATDHFEYLADVVWSDDHPPLVIRQTRDQRIVSVATVDLATGSTEERLEINDPIWVDLMPGSPTWSDRGLLTVEDRTDLDRRVLCVDGEPVPTGDIHIRSIVDVDGDNVVATAWTVPTEIHVMRVDLATGSTQPLTEKAGVHAAVSKGGTAVITATTPQRPRSTVDVFVNDAPVASIENRGVTPVLDARPQFLELGERSLASALFLPADHDGASPLPVLLDPYGGPHAQRVLKAHLPHLTSQWFADQGFAVLVVDNRGTPGRGPSFEREVWGDLAAPVLEDQLAALDAAGERFPFLDLGRVGIRGWSFGGYLAALAALRAPDRIHAAIAGAPVTTWHLYDTHYTERYLGHPDEHPAHYGATDLTSEADALTRPLLLIHGLADDNVVAAHTLRLSSALLAAGRMHQVLPLSGVTHMTPQEVVAENMLHLQRDFLLEHLTVDN